MGDFLPKLKESALLDLTVQLFISPYMYIDKIISKYLSMHAYLCIGYLVLFVAPDQISPSQPDYKASMDCGFSKTVFVYLFHCAGF